MCDGLESSHASRDRVTRRTPADAHLRQRFSVLGIGPPHGPSLPKQYHAVCVKTIVQLTSPPSPRVKSCSARPSIVSQESPPSSRCCSAGRRAPGPGLWPAVGDNISTSGRTSTWSRLTCVIIPRSRTRDGDRCRAGARHPQANLRRRP